jgi:PncC family amidohydrolase
LRKGRPLVEQDKYPFLAEVSELFRRLGSGKGATLATAESCTGGMISTWLTTPPGSSRFFLGGVCSYSNESKVSLLGVDPGLIAANGAVSGPVVEAMASGVKDCFGSTWSISVSGVAGPDGGTPEKPVGTVWIGICGPSTSEQRKFHFSGDRRAVRESAALAALRFLMEKLS